MAKNPSTFMEKLIGTLLILLYSILSAAIASKLSNLYTTPISLTIGFVAFIVLLYTNQIIAKRCARWPSAYLEILILFPFV